MCQLWGPNANVFNLKMSHNNVLIHDENIPSDQAFELLLPPYPNGFNFELIHIRENARTTIFGVEADSILFLPEGRGTKFELTTPGHRIRITGIGNTWYLTSNAPLKLSN